MPIPRNAETLLPILKLLADGKPRTNADIYDHIAKIFKLTPAERSERFSASGKLIYQNHTRWGLFILRKLGLIESDLQHHRITKKGLDPAYLSKLKSKSLRELASSSLKTLPLIDPEKREKELVATSPEDLLEAAAKRNKELIKEELLKRIRSKSSDSSFLETLVKDLGVKMGYPLSIVTGRSGDGGIDGTWYTNELKIEHLKYQAKNWASPVDVREVKNFVASITPETKGIFVTTSSFRENARKYVGENKHLDIKLIDGHELVELMIKYRVGVADGNEYHLKSVDKDYFE